MNPQTKAWIIVICTALTTGCGVVVTSIAGGCKTGMAILAGVGASAGAVVHAVMQSPNQPPIEPPKP